VGAMENEKFSMLVRVGTNKTPLGGSGHLALQEYILWHSRSMDDLSHIS